MRLIELRHLTQNFMTDDCQAADCDNAATVTLRLNPYGRRSNCGYCGSEIALCSDHLAEALDGLTAEIEDLKRIGE